MPNHVTNIVYAEGKIINSLLNENGNPDFNLVIPMHASLHEFNAISGGAETAAQKACDEPYSSNPIIKELEIANRKPANPIKLDNECFESFLKMLRNKRQYGFFHCLDFAREKWGTKWNAYNHEKERSSSTSLWFQTAWNMPNPVFVELSKKFYGSEVIVHYADEDIGSNCGINKYLDGILFSQENDKNTSNKDWRKFAYELCYPEEDYLAYLEDEDGEGDKQYG